jgi:hypothetical protein
MVGRRCIPPGGRAGLIYLSSCAAISYVSTPQRTRTSNLRFRRPPVVGLLLSGAIDGSERPAYCYANEARTRSVTVLYFTGNALVYYQFSDSSRTDSPPRALPVRGYGNCEAKPLHAECSWGETLAPCLV